MASRRILRFARRSLVLHILFLGSSYVSSYAPTQVVLPSEPISHSRHASLARRPAQRHVQPSKSFTLSNILSIRRGGSSSQLESTAFATLDAAWKANPLIAAAVVCATKASLADLVAQRRQQKVNASPKKLDWRRTLSMTVYGAFYQGMVQELIYNNVYNYLFTSATTARVVIKKVLFDAFFHNALLCIPMAYAVRAFVFQYSLATGIRQYIDDVLHHGLLLKYYALWMPVNAMIFTIVPAHWRITVMAVVSFFWMIILSTISSRSREDD